MGEACCKPVNENQRDTIQGPLSKSIEKKGGSNKSEAVQPSQSSWDRGTDSCSTDSKSSKEIIASDRSKKSDHFTGSKKELDILISAIELEVEDEIKKKEYKILR